MEGATVYPGMLLNASGFPGKATFHDSTSFPITQSLEHEDMSNALLFTEVKCISGSLSLLSCFC